MDESKQSTLRQARSQKTVNLAVLTIICIVLVVALIESFNFSAAARQLPLLVGIPVLILALYALIKEAFLAGRTKNVETADKTDLEETGEEEKNYLAITPLQSVLVVIVFSVLYVFLGFPIGATIFVFLLIWRIGKEKIWKAAFVTALIIIPFYLFFVLLLKAPVFPGILF